jgi:O-antigen/teichoic acid export membrane protein
VSTPGRLMVKNATALMSAQLVTWGLATVLAILIPRYLGPAALGKFHFATSLWAIAAMFLVFGTDTLVTKGMARDPSNGGKLLANAALLRVLLFFPAFAAVAAYLAVLGYPQETVVVVYLTGFATLVWQFAGLAQAALQGLERMTRVSLASVVSKVIYAALCIGVLIAGFGVNEVVIASAVAGTASLVILWWSLRRAAGSIPRPGLGSAVRLLPMSFPYMLSAFFLVAYIQVDMIVISLLADDSSVGWYGAADQLFGSLLFGGVVFMAVVFPSLARAGAGYQDSAFRLMRRSFNLMLALAVPMGLGLAAIADPLVLFLFGPSFANSGPILALLGIVLVLTYVNMLLGQYFISADQQNRWTVVMAVATFATIALDFALIPWFRDVYQNAGLGGAVAFIVTESAMIVVGLLMLPRGCLNRSNLFATVKTVGAGLVMLGGVWMLSGQFLAIPILAGMAIYAVLALLLGIVPRQDLALIASLAPWTKSAATTAGSGADGDL